MQLDKRSRVFHQVGSVALAQQAARAGVDVVIAQGHEAGGHAESQVGLLALVPRVVDAIAAMWTGSPAGQAVRVTISGRRR